jgi:hypothetical protein
MIRQYRFKGPRAEWMMLADWPSGSQLESYGVDPAWLDRTFMHRGWRWRVEGLHRTYRSKKPCRLVIVTMNDNHDVASISIILLKKILAQPC